MKLHSERGILPNTRIRLQFPLVQTNQITHMCMSSTETSCPLNLPEPALTSQAEK